MQSFNLDCGRLDNTSGGSAGAAATAASSSGGNVTKTNVAYLRTLSAPTPSVSHTIYQALLHNHDQSNSGKTTCGSSSGNRQMMHQRNSLAAGAGGAVGGGGGLFNAATFDHLQNSNLTNFQSSEAAAIVTDMSNGDIKSAMSSTASKAPTTILKIEETASKASRAMGSVGATTASPTTAIAGSDLPTDVESLHQKRLRQLNMEMDNLRNTSIDQSQQLSALMQQNHYCTGGVNGGGHNGSNSGCNKHKTLMTTSSCAMPKKASPITSTAAVTSSSSLGSSSSTIMTCSMTGSRHQPMSTAPATSYLLHGSDATKKGSTSTIWTSEESILRSVGAVDEDNK